MPFSSSRNPPQAPGPASTPERIAVRCSCPDPREIHTPGTRTKTSCGWLARTKATSSPSTVAKLPTVPWLVATDASARTTISSSACWSLAAGCEPKPNVAAHASAARAQRRNRVPGRILMPFEPAAVARAAGPNTSRVPKTRALHRGARRPPRTRRRTASWRAVRIRSKASRPSPPSLGCRRGRMRDSWP